MTDGKSKMKIMIDISEEDYNWIKGAPKGTTSYPITFRCLRAIANGTLLPDITEDMRTLDRSMECVLESDHRSFTNQETENGWLFDTIIEWRKMIQPYIKENENA